MSRCIPARVVRLGRKDPPFITSLVRMLLNKRRTLRRRGKFLEADTLAEKINVIIWSNQSELLNILTSQSTRNYGQLPILNTEDTTLISLSTFRLTVSMN